MPYEINPVGAAYDPNGAATLTKLNQQGAQSATLSQMAADLQANQQAAQQQQQAQGMTPQMQSYLQALAQQHARQYQLAAANPNDAANMATAQAGMEQQTQQQSPYFPIMMQMAVQKQQADLALTKADAINKTVQPMNGPMLITDPNSGEHKIVMPDGSVTGQDGTGMPFRASPDGHPITQAVGGSASQWGLPPVARAAAIKDAELLSQQKADARLAAQQTTENANGFNAQIDSLTNVAPHVPWGGGSEIAQEMEEKMANFNAGSNPNSAKQANAALSWDQGMGQNFVGSVKNLMSSGGNIRGDIPIINGLKAANGLGKTWNPQAKIEGLNTLRIVNNNNVVLQNAKLKSIETGVSVQPKVIPYQKAISLAQQNHVPAQKMFDQLRDRGYLLTPSDMVKNEDVGLPASGGQK